MGRPPLDRRRLWNGAVLGSALLLVLFAAYVVAAVFGAAREREQLNDHLQWGISLHRELAFLHLSGPQALADPQAIIDLAEQIEQRCRTPEVIQAASVLESAALDHAERPTASTRETLSRASSELDQAMDRQVARLTTALERRDKALQGISIASVAMALVLVGMLMLLRQRILTAEALSARLESALQQIQAVRELELAGNNAKAEFLATVSHEIRTPLTGILGSAELLDTQTLSQSQAERVGVIRAGGETLLSLIDALLDLSKIESGSMELHPRPYAPIPLLEETLLLFSQSAASKGLELNMWASPELPALLTGDPDRTRQVVVNLLGNAIKFTAQGEVLLRAVWRSDGLCVEIHDTGPGIAPQDHDRIMESFTQLGGRRHADNGGVGLGLPISRRLLRAMGGRLELESAPGQGSIFRALLPHTALAPPMRFPSLSPVVVAGTSASCRRASEQLQAWGAETLQVTTMAGVELQDTPVLILEPELLPDAQVPPEVHCVLLQRPGSPEHSGSATVSLSLPIRPRSLWRAVTQDEEPSVPEAISPVQAQILVVDDHPGNRAVMRDMLESLGATVHLAEGGREALDFLAQRSVDLILMDVDMPVMDGLTTTRTLRSLGQGQLIVGLSGHVTEAAHQDALEAGMDDYLTKPVRLAKLRKLLEELAGGGPT